MARILTGTVVSVKTPHTVGVKVDRLFRHRRYGKYLTRSKRYLAHDQSGQLKVGDQVKFKDSRPHSRRKRFAVISKA